MKRAALAILLFSLPAAADTPPYRAVHFTGNPDFVPLPASLFQDEQAGAVQQYGEVAILEGDHQLLAEDDQGGLAIDTQQMENIAQRFYSQYPDQFDELITFVTFDDLGNPGALAYELSVQQDVRGLGEPTFTNAQAWGAQNGFLKAFVNMKKWDQYHQQDGLPLTDPRSSLYSTLGQEFAHRWLAFMKYRDRTGHNSMGLLGRDAAHWASTLQADASVMDGNLLVDNHDGSFTVAEMFQRYSFLDLYGMGLIPPRDVPPFFRIPDAVDKNGHKVDPALYRRVGDRLFGTRENIDLAQVIAANGPRLPEYAQAPHDFRVAFLLVTRPGEKASDVLDAAATLEQARQVWEGRFWVYTGGRGTMCTQISAPCGAATAKFMGARFVEAGGNGNGVIEPGEPVDLYVTLENDGPVPANSVAVAARSDALGLNDSSSTSLPHIVARSAREAVFHGTLAPGTPCGAPILVSTSATVDKDVFHGFASMVPGVTDAWAALFNGGAQLFGPDLDGSDDATVNGWQFGVPLEYRGQLGFVFQPPSGHAGGRRVWFTGLERGHRLQEDSSLGPGTSTLWSPAIPLDGTLHPTLRYFVWYQAIDFSMPSHGGTTREDLPLLVEASVNGSPFAVIDQVTGAQPSWQQRDVSLEDVDALKPLLPLHGAMTLKFVAHNDDAATLVEAGLDEVHLVTQTAACDPSRAESVAPVSAITPAAAGGCSASGRAGGRLGVGLLLPLAALLVRRRRRG